MNQASPTVHYGMSYGTVTVYATRLRYIAGLVYLQYLREKHAMSDQLKLFNPDDTRYHWLTNNQTLLAALDDPNHSLHEKVTKLTQCLEETDFVHYKTSKQFKVAVRFPFEVGREQFFINHLDTIIDQTFSPALVGDVPEEVIPLIDATATIDYHVAFHFVEEDNQQNFIQEGYVHTYYQQAKPHLVRKRIRNHEHTATNLINYHFYQPCIIWDTAYIIANPEIFSRYLIDNKCYSNEMLRQFVTHLDCFRTFLKNNQNQLNPGIYWDINEWYQENQELFESQWCVHLEKFKSSEKWMNENKEDLRKIIEETTM